MKIVKFKRGTYGIRKWSWRLWDWVFAWKDYDTWSLRIRPSFTEKCEMEAITAAELYERLTDKGTPI